MTQWSKEPPVNIVSKGAAAFKGCLLNAYHSVWMLTVDQAPVNGVNGDGAGFMGIGSVLIRTDTGAWYRNSNTKASPTWTEMSSA